MKKTIILVLSLVLALSFVCPTYAEDVDTPPDEPTHLRFINLSSASVSLDIPGNTAQCTGIAKSMVSTDTLKLYMYLQKQTSSGWDTVASWSKQGVRIVILEKTKSGLSAGTYRVYLYVGVYDADGTFIESTVILSKLKTVS